MSRFLWSKRNGAIFTALFALAVVVAILLFHSSPDAPGAILVGNEQRATHEYVITPGTFARLTAGERVDVLPDDLRFVVGDSIRIRNDDNQSGTVGPFFVDAHSTMTQRFTSAGTYSGECNVHPSGRILIHVSKA